VFSSAGGRGALVRIAGPRHPAAAVSLLPLYPLLCGFGYNQKHAKIFIIFHDAAQLYMQMTHNPYIYRHYRLLFRVEIVNILYMVPACFVHFDKWRF
jgi:hypothetical protein